MEETDESADKTVFISVDPPASVKLEAPEKTSKDPPPSKYYCNKCNYNTYHRSVFQEHVNRHQGVKPYKCKLCPYSSVSKNYTKKHQDKHKVCACGFVSLKNRTEFKRHLKKCSRNVGQKHRISCGKCKKEFVDDRGLEIHIARMQVCSYCSEECCSLKMHMTQVHADKKVEQKNESSRTESMVKCSYKKCNNRPTKQQKKDGISYFQFECGMCGWSCSLNQKILLHLIHHPAQAVDETVIDVSVLRRCGILPPK